MHGSGWGHSEGGNSAPSSEQDCEVFASNSRRAKRARKRFFEHIRTITAYLVFPDWKTLMTTLIKSKPPPELEKQIWA
jgi:hypothetical protein